MTKSFIRFIIFTLAILSWGYTLRAQDIRTYDRGRGEVNQTLNEVGTNPYGDGNVELDENGNPINGEQSDTTKQVHIKKALESYFFSDTLRSAKNFAWNLDTYVNKIYPTVLDTLIEDFNIDYPFLKEDVGDAYKGILGGVSTPLSYFRRPNYNDFSFTAPYYSYLYTPENVPFYNVKAPYTRLAYTSAGPKNTAEENLNVLHAQNVSPSTGFNIFYQNQGTKGIYEWQRSKVKDLSMAVAHTGKKYSVHAGYIYNMVYQRENGGVVEDWHITDTTYESSLNIPVKMTDALNEMKNNTFYVVQSLGVPMIHLTDDDFTIGDKPSFYVGHSFTYNRWKKKYTDTYEGTTYDIIDQSSNEILGEKNYYENWYINPLQSRDSLSESRMSNRVFIQLQPWKRDAIVGSVNGGIGIDNHVFYQFNLDEYLKPSKGVKRNSFYAYGGVEGKYKKYLNWSSDLKYNIGGYQAGDVVFNANADLSVYVKERPITLSGGLTFRNESPSWWSDHYFSNHYSWSNSFAKETETRLEVKLHVPHIKAEAGLYQSVVGNKIYYNDLSLPTQASDVVSVTGIYARKDFTAGNVHFENRAMLQWSTNHIVAPVPLAALYLSYYYQVEAVKDVLTLKIGLDGWYNTQYYAPGYNPAIMQFYNQREKELGKYPMVDAFVAAKWKRMRIRLKYQHASQGLFDNNEYFNILHYPLNDGVLKFGVSWSFYD